MSRFITDKKIKIDLGNEEWVEIKEQLSFEEMMPIMGQLDQKNEMANVKITIPLLKLAVVGWNLKNDNGEEIKFDIDKISLLDTSTVMELVSKCTETYFAEKKNLEPSGE